METRIYKRKFMMVVIRGDISNFDHKLTGMVRYGSNVGSKVVR